jgi:hypothetical protein
MATAVRKDAAGCELVFPLQFGISAKSPCIPLSMANSQILAKRIALPENGRLPNSGAFSPRVVRGVF